jgi:hypothetical protein
MKKEKSKVKRLTLKVEPQITAMIAEILGESLEYENASQLVRGLIKTKHAEIIGDKKR